MNRLSYRTFNYKRSEDFRGTSLRFWVFLAAFASAGVVAAQEYSPEAQALMSEGYQLDRETASFNARCTGRVLHGAELSSCQQQRANLEARQQSLMKRGLALKQAEEAKRLSKASALAPSDRTAHEQASKVFDQGVRLPTSSDSMVVDARGLARAPAISEVPREFLNNQAVMAHDREARRQAAHAEELERKLAEQEKQRQSPGNHGELEVQMVRERNELVADKSRSRVEEIKKQETMQHFKQERLDEINVPPPPSPGSTSNR